MNLRNIYSIGSINVDLYKRISQNLQYLGGSAANTAYFLSNILPPQKFRVFLISLLGNDSEGDWARNELSRKKISGLFVKTINGNTGSTRISLDTDHERIIQRTSSVLSNLPNYLSEPSIKEIILKGLTHAKMGREAIETLFKIQPLLFSCDFSGFIGNITDATAQQRNSFLSWAHRLPPNRSIQLLFGNEEEYKTQLFLLNMLDQPSMELDLTNSGSIEKIRQLMRFWKSEIAVVKRGKNGANLITLDLVLKTNAIKIEAVDTTGAGDAFNAGFIAKYLQQNSLQECLDYACYLGSINCLYYGGQECPLEKMVKEE
jgi:sugar/nucleoside kinase (ribokinase family)